MSSDNKKCVRIGQVWMMINGCRVEITDLHGGCTHLPFQGRFAGSVHTWPMDFDVLDYLISKE